MNKRLQELPLLRPVESESDYCGTDVNWQPSGTVTAEVQPISDAATAELYGVNKPLAENMDLYVDNHEADRKESKRKS